MDELSVYVEQSDMKMATKSPSPPSVAYDIANNDDDGEHQGSTTDTENDAHAVAEKETTTAKLPHGTLPLVLSSKCDKTKTFCMSTDISEHNLHGDVGNVGRLHVNVANPVHDAVSLDLKGHLLKGGVVRSPSLLVVTINKTEAVVDAVVNHMLDLQPVSSVLDSETLVKGSLMDGSEDADEPPSKKRKIMSSAEAAPKSSTKAKTTTPAKKKRTPARKKKAK